MEAIATTIESCPCVVLISCSGKNFEECLENAYELACERGTTVEFERDGIHVQMAPDSVLDMVRDEYFLVVAHYVGRKAIGPGPLGLSIEERSHAHSCLLKEFGSDIKIKEALPTYPKLTLWS
jgi:hypothetical protein